MDKMLRVLSCKSLIAMFLLIGCNENMTAAAGDSDKQQYFELTAGEVRICADDEIKATHAALFLTQETDIIFQLLNRYKNYQDILTPINAPTPSLSCDNGIRWTFINSMLLLDFKFNIDGVFQLNSDLKKLAITIDHANFLGLLPQSQGGDPCKTLGAFRVINYVCLPTDIGITGLSLIFEKQAEKPVWRISCAHSGDTGRIALNHNCMNYCAAADDCQQFVKNEQSGQYQWSPPYVLHIIHMLQEIINQ